MNFEKISNGNGASKWDSLTELELPSGAYMKNGIILVGEAAREAREKDLGIRRETPMEKPDNKFSENNPSTSEVETSVTEAQEQPSEATNATDEAWETSASEPQEQSANAQEVADAPLEQSTTNTQGELAEEAPTPKEIAFVQSTALAKELHQNPDYFTYLTDADHGFAVKKTQAVDTYLEKMETADSPQEIWQAMRLGYDILGTGSDFSDEDKQRIKDMKESPLGRKKELEYRIFSIEKSLGGLEEHVQRCKAEYDRLTPRNVVDGFLNRSARARAKDSLIGAEKRRDDALDDLRRQRAEYQALENVA